MGAQLDQILNYLDRPNVTEVVLGVGRPLSVRRSGEIVAMTAAQLTRSQIMTLVQGTPIAKIIPVEEGAGPQSVLEIGTRSFRVQAGRRGDEILIRIEKAEAPAVARTETPAAEAPIPARTQTPFAPTQPLPIVGAGASPSQRLELDPEPRGAFDLELDLGTPAPQEPASRSQRLPLGEEAASRSQRLPLEPELGARSQRSAGEPELPSRSQRLPLEPELGARSQRLPLEPELGARSQRLPLEPELGARSQRSAGEPELASRSQRLPIDTDLGGRSQPGLASLDTDFSGRSQRPQLEPELASGSQRSQLGPDRATHSQRLSLDPELAARAGTPPAVPPRTPPARPPAASPLTPASVMDFELDLDDGFTSAAPPTTAPQAPQAPPAAAPRAKRATRGKRTMPPATKGSAVDDIRAQLGADLTLDLGADAGGELNLDIEVGAPVVAGLTLDPTPPPVAPPPPTRAKRPSTAATAGIPAKPRARGNTRAPSGRARGSTRAPAPTATVPFVELVRAARDLGASDLHVASGRVLSIRVLGELTPLDSSPALSLAEAEALLLPLLSRTQQEQLAERGYVDLAIDTPDGARLRTNIAKHQNGIKGTFRLARSTPATLDQLGLPKDLAKVVTHHQGLVVIAGPSGHGKTTTLAALVDLINATKAHHIITVEDPIEIVYPRKAAVVSQREVGPHTRSFAAALKGSLREDPDVIVIGELRDRETVEIALTASETGHLVIATMSTPNAAKTIDRLVDMFPPDDQAQVRASIAGALRAVIAQRLVPAADGRSVVAAIELLTGVLPLAAMIRDDKLYQLPNLMQRGRAFGMIRFDDSLLELVRTGKITAETAIATSDNKRELAATLRPQAAPEPAAQPRKSGLIGMFGGGKKGIE